MNMEVPLLRRSSVCGSVGRAYHLSDIAFQADTASGLSANRLPVRGGVPLRDHREGEELRERHGLVEDRDVLTVLLLREVAVLSRMTARGRPGSDGARPEEEGEPIRPDHSQASREPSALVEHGLTRSLGPPAGATNAGP